MKYKCLVFDHDDTVVNSTATIHYPCFVEFCEKYRPDIRFSIEDFVRYNFEPGLLEFYHKICNLTEDEMETQYAHWLSYTKDHRAKAVCGIREIMEKHREKGGIITVVSHSYGDNILKDYEVNGLPRPDMVFGFEQPRDELKPSPVPVQKIMAEYKLLKKDVLVIDDLKPGYLMARAADVSFAAAGWSFDIPKNSAFLKENADYYCKSVADLADIVL